MIERTMRDFFLRLSNNKAMTKVAKKYGPKLGAKRFVAGEEIETASTVIKSLNAEGLAVTIDYLENLSITKQKRMKWRTFN